ncbi:MAG: hypothetical protein KGJ05_07660, partial [Alphaproteobacteria bacterium]|nr:hypothetical protein [Alphaproteobacteria bacterium]
TEHDIRMLDTELATRTNWRQLEKWNSDTLGLSTPSAAQFVGDTTALARFDPAKLKGAPEVPVAAMASVTEDAESLAAAKLQDKAQSLSVPETATVTAAAPDPVAAPVSEKLAQAQPPAHKGQAQRHFEGTSAVTHLVMLDDALREALHGKAQR